MLLEKINKLDNKSLLIFISVIFLSILLLFFTASHLLSTKMEMLYGNLNGSDLSEIISSLHTKNIKYKVENNGKEILVDSNKVLELRAILASEDIPSNGSIIGYEIFDKKDILNNSQFLQNINYIRSMEGELSRTISSFEKIQSARVHLSIPKKELFSNEKNEASASVILKVKKGNEISQKDMRAMHHIIYSSIPKIKKNNITVVGTSGQSFIIANKDENQIFSSSEIQNYKYEMESKLKNSIEHLISQVIGLNKVKANVNLELDLDKYSTNKEKYDPEGQVLRSSQSLEDKNENSNSGGEVSVSNNIPNGNSSADSNKNKSQKIEETKNYEISKEISMHEKSIGSIKKINAAVIIDGNYETKEDGNKIYKPQLEETIEKIKKLISSAIGINSERGDHIEIVNMKFIDNEVEESMFTSYLLPLDFHKIIKYSITSVIFLFALVAMKSIINRILNMIEKSNDRKIEAEKNISNLEKHTISEKEENIKEKSEDVISNDPEIAFNIIKKWMTQKN